MRAPTGEQPQSSIGSKVRSSTANLGGNAQCLTLDIRLQLVLIGHEGFLQGTTHGGWICWIILIVNGFPKS